MHKLFITISILLIIYFFIDFINQPNFEAFGQGQFIPINTQTLLTNFNNPNIPQTQSTINFNFLNNPFLVPSNSNSNSNSSESKINIETEKNISNNRNYNSTNINTSLFINTNSLINPDVTNLNVSANKSRTVSGSGSGSDSNSDSKNRPNMFEFKEYGPGELIYTNKDGNIITKYFRRRKLSNNSVIYYIETYSGNDISFPISTVFYNLEDLKLPNIDALKLDNVIIGHRNLGTNIKPDRLTMYGYTNKIYLTNNIYNYFQPFLLSFMTNLSPELMKNKIYDIFKINYQLNAFVSTIQDDKKKYNQYVIYLRPSICDNLIKSFGDNINVIPLLQELKIKMNGVTLSVYNSYELNESLLCMRVGAFVSNNPEDILNFNNELINFVINPIKIKNENIYYNLLLIEGLGWDHINNFMNKLSTYNFVFHISLHIVQHYNK